jgi:peroxidase
MIMAFSAGSVGHPIAAILLLGLAVTASAQLSATFYDASCPSALATIKSAVTAAVNNEPRMGASLLRLHFHDCFVQVSNHRSLPWMDGTRRFYR